MGPDLNDERLGFISQCLSRDIAMIRSMRIRLPLKPCIHLFSFEVRFGQLAQDVILRDRLFVVRLLSSICRFMR
jgi:hypothetical protein